MGAVTFSLDPLLVNAFKSVLPLRVFIETGTFRGDTVSVLESYFDRIISIELSEDLWKEADKRFALLSHVQVLHGNSSDKLLELKDELKKKEVLYWLDAHWCVAENRLHNESQCPLIDELKAIEELNNNSVVLIDDARLFLAPPLSPHEISQWPSFQEVVRVLQSLSANHELMIINDVIAFYPLAARAAIVDYAHLNGVDWLLAFETFSSHKLMAEKLVQKELCIRAQNESLIKLGSMLNEKESINNQQLSDMREKEVIIKEQKLALKAYAAAFTVLPFFLSTAKFLLRFPRRMIKILKPRLGNLNQYQPRPITPLQAVRLVPMDKSLRFSLVTPSFEQGKFISRTISSVMDQQYPNMEYFVQDGGSTDSTIEVLKNFQHVLTGWSSEKDSGQSQAINRGIKKTSGDIICWLNSDDLLLPGALYTVANFFQAHPEVDVVYGDRLLIDEDDMEIGRWILPHHDSKMLSWVDYIPQESLFWRRSIWEKVDSKIDETFCFAMDWDLLVRFRDVGANFAHIPRFLGAFRIHEKQKTSSQIMQAGQLEMDRIRMRLLGHIPTQQEVRKAAAPFLFWHIVCDLKYRVRKAMRGVGC